MDQHNTPTEQHPRAWIMEPDGQICAAPDGPAEIQSRPASWWSWISRQLWQRWRKQRGHSQAQE